jgi:mono/diheme cytochrome c family protein
MNRLAFGAVVGSLSITALAGPFDQGDPAKGQALVQQRCMSCHVSKFGGDGAGVYTRAEHRITSPQALVTQIAHCSEGAHAGLSADQQRDVAAYLNQAFYKFK